jgi:DNA-binding response OmpR family regulator
MKVLLIEDEPKVVEYLRNGLSEQGWVVDVATDGEDGAFMAMEYDFDVVILDVMLPKLDGFSVLKRIRAQKQTPVIMLTARDRVDDRVQGLRSGADDYLIKPFSFLELVERLYALTRRARPGIDADLRGRPAGRSDQPAREPRRHAARTDREGIPAAQRAGAPARRDPVEDADHRDGVGRQLRERREHRRDGDQAAAREARRTVCEPPAAYHSRHGLCA